MDKLRESQKQIIQNMQTTGNKSGDPNGDDEAYQVIALPKCKGVHLFHKECLHQQFKHQKGDFITCSVCETLYGTRIGGMPDGTMTWGLKKQSCQGYEGYDAIQFSYSFANGVQANGTPYTGTARTAYLPATPEGIEIFKMMVEAFRRYLSFMVGTSITTGQQNTTVWSGIHHKTSMRGGPFGYPDKTYFDRVTAELNVRGVDADAVKNH